LLSPVLSEIPTSVAQPHAGYVLRCEGDVPEPTHLVHMALADHDGIEGSAINEFHGDNLIAGTGLRGVLEVPRRFPAGFGLVVSAAALLLKSMAIIHPTGRWNIGVASKITFPDEASLAFAGVLKNEALTLGKGRAIKSLIYIFCLILLS
jgi:hypothetical protein